MRTELKARMRGTWLSYVGAAYGAVEGAGLCDLDLIDFYSISGMGAHFVVHEVCDASSITVYNWMDDHMAALDRLGILSEVYLAFPSSESYEAALRRAITNIRASIDRGAPVILWGIDVPEFGIVYGYDDGDGVLLVSGVFGQGEQGSTPIRYEQIARSCAMAPILHYQVPVERVSIDLEKARRDALATWVARMERPVQMNPRYHVGLAAYDVWLAALGRPDLDQRGLRYLVFVYAEVKDFWAAYVNRLAESGFAEVGEAAAAFRMVSQIYERMMAALGQVYEEPQMLEAPVSQEQLQALDELLREAKAAEGAALGLLKRALGE